MQSRRTLSTFEHQDDHRAGDGFSLLAAPDGPLAVGGADTIGATAGTASTISIGGVRTEWVNSFGDHDWFAINLEAGQTYVFTLSGYGVSSLDDPFLSLRNAGGVEVDYDDDGGDGLNSRMTFTATSSGTYYLDVGAFSDSYEGRYQLTANIGEPPPPKPTYTNDEVIDVFARWGNPWTIDTIGFTFLASSARTGFQPFSDAEKVATRLILSLFSDVINLSFVERADNGTYDNEITFENISQGPGIWGSASGGANVGYVLVDDDYVPATFALGTYDFMALMHEIGHALNVLHPGDYNAGSGGVITYEDSADYVQDTRQYTVMSYFDASYTGAYHGGQFASTPLLHDVLGFQALYGANMTTRTGDTVYGFNSTAGRNVYNFALNGQPVIAIWDAGGTDKIDLSGYGMSCVLDLREGGFSSVGGLTLNLAICYDAEIENGTGGSQADTIYGNGLNNVLVGGAGDDLIIAGAGADTLNGGIGADDMRGAAGDDTYIVNAGGDVTFEVSADGGIDTVQSIVTRTLSANIENLTLTGPNAINGTGNELANVLTGNSAANTLSGGVGADRLIGGGGSDTLIGGRGVDTITGGLGVDYFVLNAPLGVAHADTVTDFSVGVDKIRLEDAIFTTLGVGALSAQAYHGAANAHDATDRILYQAATGALFYDSDGTGSALKVQIATLSSGLALSASDFVVV